MIRILSAFALSIIGFVSLLIVAAPYVWCVSKMEHDKGYTPWIIMVAWTWFLLFVFFYQAIGWVRKGYEESIKDKSVDK